MSDAPTTYHVMRTIGDHTDTYELVSLEAYTAMREEMVRD